MSDFAPPPVPSESTVRSAPGRAGAEKDPQGAESDTDPNGKTQTRKMKDALDDVLRPNEPQPPELATATSLDTIGLLAA